MSIKTVKKIWQWHLQAILTVHQKFKIDLEHYKICIPQSVLLGLFGGKFLLKKSFFSANYGKIASGITNILRAAQHTHTSNVPRSPLLGVILKTYGYM